MLEVQESVKSSEIGRVRHLTVDHPPRNQISIGILQRLAELVSECEGDDNVRAILLDSANQTPPFAADGEALPGRFAPHDHLRHPRGRVRGHGREGEARSGRKPDTRRPDGADGATTRERRERREAGGEAGSGRRRTEQRSPG
jgi:hypothetical protein